MYKQEVEKALKDIKNYKLDILMLEKENERLCKENNKKIEELKQAIEAKELEMQEVLNKSGERKITTPAGWCAFRSMPDKWEYDDDAIIRWCKENNQPYYRTIEIVKKIDLKKAIIEGVLKKEEVSGVTITPQEPTFKYKIKELL